MKKLIAAILSTVLVISCTGLSVWAEMVGDNPNGTTLPTLSFNDTMENNYGTINNNHGTINNNYGTVKDNNSTINNNHGTIDHNNSTVKNNYGTIGTNISSVENNYGGTIKGPAFVTNNYGGTIEPSSVAQNNFYEILLSADAQVTLDGVTKTPDYENKIWAKQNGSFTVTAKEGYYFENPPTADGMTVAEKEKGKIYEISGISGDVTTPIELSLTGLKPGTPLDPTPDPDPAPKPEPKPDNKPSPSAAEDEPRPDPADKKATEMYDFWQNVKRKIKNTEEGKTLRVAVPAEYTYMPASVMETLRLNPEVSLKLSWGRDTVMIKAGTAQPKQKLKAYWSKKQLTELYCK